MLASNSIQQTKKIGKALGENLFPGAFVALFGQMGAGKTAFTTGIGEALGYDEVSSPTFTIVMEHVGQDLELLHFDSYRLGTEDELFDIGFSEYLQRNAAIVMEWPENVMEALPANRLEIHISGNGNARSFKINGFGKRHEQLAKALEREI